MPGWRQVYQTDFAADARISASFVLQFAAVGEHRTDDFAVETALGQEAVLAGFFLAGRGRNAEALAPHLQRPIALGTGKRGNCRPRLDIVDAMLAQFHFDTPSAELCFTTVHDTLREPRVRLEAARGDEVENPVQFVVVGRVR